MKQNCKKDIYEVLLEELEVFYGRIPNRMSFDKAVRDTLTISDCKVFLLFPKHTEEPFFLSQAVQLYEGDDFQQCFDHLIDTGFLCEWDRIDGIPRYVRNYLFQIMFYHKLEANDTYLARAFIDWFDMLRNDGATTVPLESPEYRVLPFQGAVDGSHSMGEVALDLRLPDQREVVIYDQATEMIKKARRICLTTCYCRTTKDIIGNRECNHPLETCIMFDKLADETLGYGGGREITVEEALDVVKMCHEHGLVSQISNAKSPGILCNCCECCCAVMPGYKKGIYHFGKPSRYITTQQHEKCVGCRNCIDVCPMHLYEMKDGKSEPNYNKCIGCGLCVSRCSGNALSLVVRPFSTKYLPDRENMDIMFL